MTTIRIAIIIALASCGSTNPTSPGCPRGSFPYWVTDGERCVFVGPLPSLAASKPRIGFYRTELVETPLNAYSYAVPTDTLTITDGFVLVLDGPMPYARVNAPNTFRDPDGKCYSLNVLRVDGTRVPVNCP